MKQVLFLSALLTATATYGGEQTPDTLGISKNVSLDEVVVTAIQAVERTPVAYTDISREELTQANNGQGIPSLIASSPSVIMTSDAGTGIGYSGFRIRGTDANRINITVNGVPLNDAESHGVFWVNMPDFASSVEQIQIQRGVGTSTNGSAAFGATVALQTQKPQLEPNMEYTLSAGSFGTVRHTVKGGSGLLNEHWVAEGRYSNIRSDGFIDRAWARMSSHHLSLAWYGENTLLKFQTFGSAEETYQAWNGVSSEHIENNNRTYNSCGEYTENALVKFYPNQTDNYQQQHYHLTGSHRINNHLNANLTLHYTRGIGYYEDYKANAKYSAYKLPPYRNPEGEEVSRSDLVRRKWLDNDFYGGIYSINYQNRNLRLTLGGGLNRYIGNHFGRVLWVKAANALPSTDYAYYFNTGKKSDRNVYLKLNHRLSHTLNGYVDVQYRGIHYSIQGSDDKAGDHLEVDKHWNFFNPKAGINYRRGAHNAFASFAVANREPNRDNFTEAAPSERPVHETLYDCEAGYSYRKETFQAGLNLYYMDYTNQLILTGKISEIGEALTANIPNSFRLGVELTAAFRLGKLLKWNGNLTLSRNRIQNFTEYVDNWDTGKQEAFTLGTTRIAYSPELIANSIWDLTLGNFSASLLTQTVGRQYLDNTSEINRSVAPYSVSNLRLGYLFHPTFIRTLGVDLTINNLLNASYATGGWVYSRIEGGERHKDDGYFTQAGIHAMLRLTMRF
ncbi:MAG: TonB-dependent receptor plug domain-containing protein [Tannerellaceae bacterium]|jgi:iron complex outermembrane receptor protein|nr:TonB-dependent receptor plug domain-containing protein [Tannerellaceae bacterium]